MRVPHLVFLWLVGCRGGAPPDRPPADDARVARRALDSLLAEARTAHLETNAAQLAAGLADGK